MTDKNPANSAAGKPADPHAHLTRTLLPSQIAKLKAERKAEGKPACVESDKQERGPIRAINEDDDGYDPYSDLHDRPAAEPLFERDPWS